MRYRTKVTLTLLSVAGFSGGLLFAMSYISAHKVAFELIQEKVYAIAVSIAPEIDGDAHDRIRTEADDGNEDYLKVRKVLRAARDANQKGDLPVRFVYTYRPSDNSGRKWEYVVDAEEDGSEDKSSIGEKVQLGDYEKIFPSLDAANVDTKYITDDYGTWLSAWAPVRNSAGEPVALVGIDIEAANVMAKLHTLFIGGAAALVVALLAAAAASFLLSGMMTAPLATLHRQVALITDGDLKTRIPIETKDEFGELGESIHGMADGLRERESFKEALVRFVSSGSGDSVIDEKAGKDPEDARRVTVVIAGLQNFEEVSKALPRDQVFSFLADWYSTMIDAILTHRGAIEKSSGQLVTATFGAPINDPDQERHAIEAALSMQQDLTRLRKRWKISGESRLTMDATIHTGHVTVSGENDVHLMELDSLDRIIGVASLIRSAAQAASAEGIIISEVTENGLKGTIPISYIRSIELGRTGEMLSLHQVQMPEPAS